jgi:hypothetical protein
MFKCKDGTTSARGYADLKLIRIINHHVDIWDSRMIHAIADGFDAESFHRSDESAVHYIIILVTVLI